MARQQKQTATERIRATLADAIVRGEIAQGVTLDEASLAEKFAVSRTPVREAIRQLEAIGFAEARPHRGAVVPNFTPERLTEMFAVMAELEALCARFAAERATDDEKRALREAHDACAHSARQGDIDVYYQTNLDFHEAVYAISHNSFLAEVTLSVRNRVSPFRKAQFRSFNRLMKSVEEHARVVDAILCGDPDGAAAAMIDHMNVVRSTVGEVSPTLRPLDDQAAETAER
ncbi:GntR family transcriptional regulator [Pelagibacterium montanilacus]|uniref:GntR family transcriptional regulator n=1 Tax=Pelagibacterium montanilacus TaxID=2185280 RepID=UPI000F8DF41D|nr:GntR family transcriptional regulator [Pelagibacterium montanilacus]